MVNPYRRFGKIYRTRLLELRIQREVTLFRVKREVFLPCAKGYAKYNHRNYKNSVYLAGVISEADHLLSLKSFLFFLISPHKGQITTPNKCSSLVSEQHIYTNAVNWLLFNTTTCFGWIPQPPSGRILVRKRVKWERLLLVNSGYKIIVNFIIIITKTE